MHRKRQVDQYLVAGLSRFGERRLRDHLARCDECRAYYDEQVLLLRVLRSAADDPTPDEDARMMRRAFEGMGMAFPARAHDRAGWLERVLLFPGRWVQGAGLAVAALVLVVTLLPRAPPIEPSPSPLEGPLSSVEERAVGSAPPVGLRIRCLDAGHPAVLAKAEVGPRAPLASLACPEDSVISFSPTNLSEEDVYVFVVGMADHAVRWYAPFLPGDDAVRVSPGAIDEPLAVVAGTGLDEATPSVTLYVLFSDVPMSGHTVEAQLERPRGVRLSSALDRLPVAASWQARLELTSP